MRRGATQRRISPDVELSPWENPNRYVLASRFAFVARGVPVYMEATVILKKKMEATVKGKGLWADMYVFLSLFANII